MTPLPRLDNKTVFITIITGLAVAFFLFWYAPKDRPAQTQIYIEQEPTVAELDTKDETPPTVSEVTRESSIEPRYISVKDSCGPNYDGECLLVRSGPSTSTSAIGKLRTGIVLKVTDTVNQSGQLWYKVIFDEWLRYPERVESDWYVAADFVEAITVPIEPDMTSNLASSTKNKRILVDRSEQKLYAHESGIEFLTATVSTGLELTPTPRGTFTIFRKIPSRYMQGPLPYLDDKQYYDLPGVPWNLYFTEQGAVIHGAYWHDSFGKPYSHGCVNMSPDEAKMLYSWAELGTTVIVQD